MRRSPRTGDRASRTHTRPPRTRRGRTRSARPPAARPFELPSVREEGRAGVCARVLARGSRTAAKKQRSKSNCENPPPLPATERARVATCRDDGNRQAATNPARQRTPAHLEEVERLGERQRCRRARSGGARVVAEQAGAHHLCCVAANTETTIAIVCLMINKRCDVESSWMDDVSEERKRPLRHCNARLAGVCFCSASCASRCWLFFTQAHSAL